MSSTFSAFSTKTAVVKASFCPFLHVISVPRKGFKPFFTLHILATGLLFAAIYPAFWCFLPQIMLQKALDGVQNVYLNNLQWLFIHLCAHLVLPQVSWRNTRKNVGERRNGQKNRSHNVKFRAQNVTLSWLALSSTQHNFAVSKPCPCRPLKNKIRHREF